MLQRDIRIGPDLVPGTDCGGLIGVLCHVLEGAAKRRVRRGILRARVPDLQAIELRLRHRSRAGMNNPSPLPSICVIVSL